MPRKKITVWVNICSRCYYKWQGDVEAPVRCASCRSPLWNKPYATTAELEEVAKTAAAARWSKKGATKKRNLATRRAKKGTSWL
jgi:hypothetical protein